MKKIAVFLADGFEEIEALTVVDICRRAGMDVTVTSITDSLQVAGSHKIPVIADKCLADLDFQAMDMLVLPGGMPGTKNLEACDALMTQVDAFYANERFIAAICAAPTVFGHRGILKGRKACCYPGMEDGLLEAKVSMDLVCVDGKVITSRGMGTAIEFALTIVEVLDSKEKADALAKGIVYRL